MPKKDTPKETTQMTPIPTEQEVLKSFGGIDPHTNPRRLGVGVDPKKLLILILVILAVGGMYGTYSFYGKYRAVLQNPNLEVQKETEALVSALGKLMELPQDETPTIATISNKEKLNGQPFFAAGENGDKLFTYTKAMKAVLYRPKTNKIINVAPIVVSQEATVAPETRQNTSTPAVKKKFR